jgi:hypothetical protein
MNCKTAYQLGVESGQEAARCGDFTPGKLENEEAFLAACYEICENKRQFAGHPGYDFNREPNAEGLWDAFDEGESVGIRKDWGERHKHRACVSKRTRGVEP